MTTKKSGADAAQQALKILANCITTYEDVADTILNQKPMQIIDYDEQAKLLDKNIVTAHSLAQKMRELHIVFEHFDELTQALVEVCQALSRITNGLGDKANRTGKYGWFSYRGDLKLHQRKRQAYYAAKQLFATNINSEPDDETLVTAAARILDPLSDHVIEQDIELFKDQYDESVDADGYVYVMRGYDNGKQSSVMMKKDIWLEAKKIFVTSPGEPHAKVDDIMANILKGK